MNVNIVLLVLLSALVTGDFAQKKVKSSGEATIKIEDNMSKKEALAKAKELAIVNAIEQAFGSYVEQEANLKVEDGQESFHLVGAVKVKGEWISTSKESSEEFVVERDGTNELWIKYSISGIVREIVRAKANFHVQSLNCPQQVCRTNDFIDGESLYVHFKTPTNGNLTIYLANEQEAYRILPYQEMGNEYINAVPVVADKDYIFFSDKHDYFQNFPPTLVDELEMYAEKDIERMEMYIIYSSGDFSKPLLESDTEVEKDGSTTPKSLSMARFQQWLTHNKAFSDNFGYTKQTITIKKKY